MAPDGQVLLDSGLRAWRQALGPTIGDSLAVARTSLHFTKSA